MCLRYMIFFMLDSLGSLYFHVVPVPLVVCDQYFVESPT